MINPMGETMSKNRKLLKARIRKIIKEECCGSVASPCPIETASELRSSGMSGEEVMTWIGDLISNFHSGGTAEELPQMLPEPDQLAYVAEENANKGKFFPTQREISTMTQAQNRGGTIFGVGFKK
jgi:hypothetical protein